MLKFVIWGLGRNGKILYEMLGKSRIAAYIDRDTKYIGKEYGGITVITLNEYIAKYSKYPIIISAIAYEHEIRKTLVNKGISKFFLYSREMYSIINICQQMDLKSVLKECDANGDIYVYGQTLLGLILYDYLASNSYNCWLVHEDEEFRDANYFRDNFGVNTILSSGLETREGMLILTQEDKKDEKNIKKFKGTKYSFYELAGNKKIYSHPELKVFKDLHQNKRCFIVGTGPSLQIDDLETLRKHNEICISVNGIFKGFGQTKWRPDYYIISDASGMLQWRDAILEMDVKDKFISDTAWFFRDDVVPANIHKWHMQIEWGPDRLPPFTEDFSEVSYCGDTITYDGALQLAVYMGFSEIYLIGVDCHQYENGEKQHFVENYQAEGFQDAKIHSDKQRLAYESAKRYAEKHQIHIYNATRGGYLEVFERVNFDNLFIRD